LVKSLHLLETIASRIGDVEDRRIYLTREAVGGAIDDPAEAVIRALASPLAYPPLADSIVPGDRVAIALGADVPQAIEIVRGAVEAFARAGVDAEACSIVAVNEELGQLCRTAFDGKDAPHVSVVVHDPDDEKLLCFFGVNRRKEPLVVNRTIFEADVVLPIGRAKPYGGAFESLFPQFSSAAVIEQFRTPANRATLAARKLLRRQISQAGERIGAPMLVQVVPGPGDSAAEIVAGESRRVAHSMAEKYRQRWSQLAARRASVVIATVTGGPLSQTWANVGRALAAAGQLVDDEGAIAICTNLDRSLGESMGRLVGQTNPDKVMRKVFHEHAEDSWAAWQIARALARSPVYFMSQLEADAVEEMGLAPVSDIDELVRLAGRRESTIVLEDAQSALAVIERELADE